MATTNTHLSKWTYILCTVLLMWHGHIDLKITGLSVLFCMEEEIDVLCRRCNLVLMGGWYLRMAEAVEACMSSCTQPERPHRPYWQLQWVGRIRPELCGQKCSSKPDQISNHRVVGSNPGSAIPSWLRVRTVLGSIGEELALAICLSCWAKPALWEGQPSTKPLYSEPIKVMEDPHQF